ncbi:MAG: aminoglycoside phosphotransferase family protein [Candidatus Pacebacteria bacterium]|nr:aminoglycoside phosphotransferase family protein [Candidatus Paceibacterota bacterium]
MQKVENLFDPNFVKGLFVEKVLPLYPDFKGIKSIKVVSHKKLLWTQSFHIVLEFRTKFIKANGKTVTLPIFCSGHSHESRKNVFEALTYLWNKGFSRGYLSIPHPLFYWEDLNCSFYRGVTGENLYHYIKQENFAVIEDVVAKTARWFAKLHKIQPEEQANFSPINSRIQTVLPGKEHILNSIVRKHPEHLDLYQKAYDYFISAEEDFLASTDKRWLVHGDAHPENVIKMGAKKIAVIDFTDLSLGDFARDLGCFLQQVQYMAKRKINDDDYGLKLQQIFLDNYLKNAKISLDYSLKQRISNYYYWTSIRTATFLLIGIYYRPERAKLLLDRLESNLGGQISLFN